MAKRSGDWVVYLQQCRGVLTQNVLIAVDVWHLMLSSWNVQQKLRQDTPRRSINYACTLERHLGGAEKIKNHSAWWARERPAPDGPRRQ